MKLRQRQAGLSVESLELLRGRVGSMAVRAMGPFLLASVSAATLAALWLLVRLGSAGSLSMEGKPPVCLSSR